MSIHVVVNVDTAQVLKWRVVGIYVTTVAPGRKFNDNNEQVGTAVSPINKGPD